MSVHQEGIAPEIEIIYQDQMQILAENAVVMALVSSGILTDT